MELEQVSVETNADRQLVKNTMFSWWYLSVLRENGKCKYVIGRRLVGLSCRLYGLVREYGD